MQYRRAPDLLIREVVILFPALGPIHILKSGISSRFYCIGMRRTDTLNLGLILSLRRKWRGSSSNTTHPSHGVLELSAHILHCYVDSSRPGQLSSVMQPSAPQA